MTDESAAGPESERRARAYLDRAIEILARLSFGQFDLTIELDDVPDEFIELFAGLSMLSEDLRDAHAELAEANRELERQVSERTEQLRADIRKRESVEVALRASEAMYRSLVDTSPDPIVLCAPDARIHMANRAFLTVFRVGTREAAVGGLLHDFVAPDDRKRAADWWSQPEQPGNVKTCELDFERRDGTHFPGELRSTVVGSSTAERKGVLSVIRDLTERRQRDNELLRAAKLESLGTLAGGIAHDFNNALATITGCLFLAATRVRDDPETHGLLLEAIDAAFRSTALTKQLLTFSKGGAPVKKCIHAAGLLRRVLEFCLHGSPVAGKLELGTGLWPIDVDEGQLEQVLHNLVINAKQAMPTGGNIQVRAENVIAADPEEDPGAERRYLRISVRDQGVGIAPEDQKRIFDPYFTTKPAGSGLGLATAYSVVRKHGGFMRCTSSPGQGATFEVHIPASDGIPSATAESPPPPVSGARRILVMDDDPRVCATTQRLLQQAGYKTVGARSGSEAVSAYVRAKTAGEAFAAVIMDLTVAGADGGKEAVRRLLEVDRDARAIVASGYSNDPVLSNYRSYGFVGMLTKPFRFEDLIRVVEAAVTSPR